MMNGGGEVDGGGMSRWYAPACAHGWLHVVSDDDYGAELMQAPPCLPATPLQAFAELLKPRGKLVEELVSKQARVLLFSHSCRFA
jgi:hypothetical protein